MPQPQVFPADLAAARLGGRECKRKVLQITQSVMLFGLPKLLLQIDEGGGGGRVGGEKEEEEGGGGGGREG